MEFHDRAAIGELSIYKEFPDGTRECVLDADRNAITMKSRRHHLGFLYDSNTPFDLLETFKIGVGGTIDPEGLRPLVPDPTRNDLYSPVVIPTDTITLTPSSNTDDTQAFLQIVFTLAQDEANGLQINECAVFKESGDMFNIKTFRSIEKSESFSLVFDWKIRYV